MNMRKFLYHALIVGFVLFSLAPTFYELSRMGDLKPERNFELVHNFPTDYNFYLSRIKQGMEGRWTVVERYTSEPHTGGFIHGFYLLLGQIGRYAGVPLGREADVYHVARVVLGVALLVATLEFCKGTMGTKGAWGILAFLLAVTASSFPKLVEVNGVWRFGGYMAWWSVMDSLQRITFIPHILAGQVMIVFLIRELGELRELREKMWSVVFLGMLAFVLGMVFPPGLVFVIGVIGALWVLQGRNTKEIIPYGAVFLMGSAALVYLALMTSFYPWKRLAEVDVIRPLPFDFIEYAKAVGVMGVIGVFGGIWAMIKREKTLYPAIAWEVAWIGFLIIFRFVPQQSPLRFSEMVPHIPLAVLSAYLLKKIGEIRGMRAIGAGMAVVLVASGLFHMYSSFLWQKDFIAAMGYIWDATRGEGVIITETTAGNYIPARTGNSVYMGHDNTVRFEEKKVSVKQFFSGKMNEAWLRETHASYIFFGPQEREDSGGKNLTTFYPFLQEVYKNNYVTIYKIIE